MFELSLAILAFGLAVNGLALIICLALGLETHGLALNLLLGLNSCH
jgi:hypothetical protein